MKMRTQTTLEDQFEDINRCKHVRELEDLKIQRTIARQNFRGVIANNPVSMVRRIEDPPGANQKHIYVEGDKQFSIEMGNEPFLSTDEMPLLKHLTLSREELRARVNELYRGMISEMPNK